MFLKAGLRIYRFSGLPQAITLSTPQPSKEPAMPSPWIDLLFLHGHATPADLGWRPDQPACRCQTEQVEVDVARLPLPLQPESRHAGCTC
jgi:hypothetical protein